MSGGTGLAACHINGLVNKNVCELEAVYLHYCTVYLYIYIYIKMHTCTLDDLFLYKYIHMFTYVFTYNTCHILSYLMTSYYLYTYLLTFTSSCTS